MAAGFARRERRRRRPMRLIAAFDVPIGAVLILGGLVTGVLVFTVFGAEQKYPRPLPPAPRPPGRPRPPRNDLPRPRLLRSPLAKEPARSRSSSAAVGHADPPSPVAGSGSRPRPAHGCGRYRGTPRGRVVVEAAAVGFDHYLLRRARGSRPHSSPLRPARWDVGLRHRQSCFAQQRQQLRLHAAADLDPGACSDARARAARSNRLRCRGGAARRGPDRSQQVRAAAAPPPARPSPATPSDFDPPGAVDDRPRRTGHGTPLRRQTSLPSGIGTKRRRIPAIFRPASTGAITSISSGRHERSP